MVGNWMRDFKFANEVFSRILSENAGINITVVTLDTNFKFFRSHPRLRLVFGVSDEELRDLYQSAGVLFLPLKSFVANNAVLEMAACDGLIYVASNQTPPEDYSALITHTRLEVDTAVRTLKGLTASGARGTGRSGRADVVEKYSWETVGRLTSTVLLSN